MYASIASIINQALALDPKAKHALTSLEGKSLQLVMRPLPQPILLKIQGQQVFLSGECALADVTLAGHVLDWARLGLAPKHAVNQLFQERLQLTGDALLAQALKAIFTQLELDWESILAPWTGDFFAYKAGDLVRKFQARRKLGQGAFSFQLSNFLQEEIQVTPPREEVADFCDEVDALVLDVDRLEARLMRQKHD